MRHARHVSSLRFRLHASVSCPALKGDIPSSPAHMLPALPDRIRQCTSTLRFASRREALCTPAPSHRLTPARDGTPPGCPAEATLFGDRQISATLPEPSPTRGHLRVMLKFRSPCFSKEIRIFPVLQCRQRHSLSHERGYPHWERSSPGFQQ